MTIEYLKKAAKTPATGEDETRETVATMLSEIEAGGEDKAREYGEKLEGRHCRGGRKGSRSTQGRSPFCL